MEMRELYKFKNPNPKGLFTGDCVPRALSVVLNCSWDEAYMKLMVYGFREKMMPSANFIHDKLLQENGFIRFTACSECYTVREFTEKYASGVYLLGTGNHVVGVINGDYYDSFDSGDEYVVWIYEKRRIT